MSLENYSTMICLDKNSIFVYERQESDTGLNISWQTWKTCFNSEYLNQSDSEQS